MPPWHRAQLRGLSPGVPGALEALRVSSHFTGGDQIDVP